METTYGFQRRVAFADTDMAGIAHFTSFLRYMEEAEHAFLRSRGLSVVLEDEKGKLGFPKLHVECDYRRPARYEDVLHVQVRVTCEDRKSLRYDCEFTRHDQHRTEVLASGQLRVAFCRFPADGGRPYALPIKDDILDRLFQHQSVT